MLEFVQDDDRLREEGKKAKKNKNKYVGMTSDSSMGFRSGGVAGTVGGKVMIAKQALALGVDGVEGVMTRTGGMILGLMGMG